MKYMISLACLVLIGCGSMSVEPKGRPEAQFQYAKDPRTNLCFAAVFITPGAVKSVVLVPCDRIPESILSTVIGEK